MFDYADLIGREYVAGSQDCFGLGREYFKLAHGLHIPNFARPNEFWTDPNLRLYDAYTLTGFKLVTSDRLEIGDVLLMPLMAAFETHAAIVINDHEILHHLPNQLSRVERMKPRWYDRTTRVLRHPTVKKPEAPRLHLHEVINANVLRDPKVQDAIAEVLDGRE